MGSFQPAVDTLLRLANTGEVARTMIRELARLGFDDASRALCLAADHEAAQLRAIAACEHHDFDAVRSRAETHLARLDQLLSASASRAAERCCCLADELALSGEWDDNVGHSAHLRLACAVSRRLSNVAS